MRRPPTRWEIISFLWNLGGCILLACAFWIFVKDLS